MEGLFFNIDFGFLEGVVRGYRNGLLTSNQYVNLTQCDTLDDLKLQLSGTDYGNFLSNVNTSLSTSIINDKLSQTLYDQFNYIKSQAVEPLSKFLNYITYGYMIDNVALMITGTIHERDRTEILERCHPLGWFDTLPTLSIATDLDALYNTVLIDTPLAPYFKDCLSIDDLDDMNIEIIRNTLYKAYLEDFKNFIETEFSEPDKTIMLNLLSLEADRRVINISLNSLGNQEITSQDKLKLFPNFGKLYPTHHYHLSQSEDIESIKSIIESVGDYRNLFDSSTSNKTIEDWFYLIEMENCKNSFTQQFTLSSIWAWIKSKEQEIRNITWIAECIAQNQKNRIDSYISVY